MCEAKPLLTSGVIFDLKKMKNATAAIIALQTGRRLMKTGRQYGRVMIKFQGQKSTID